MQQYTLSERHLKQFAQLWRAHKQPRAASPRLAPRRQPAGRQALCVLLLEDLTGWGPAHAAVLTHVPANVQQLLTLSGRFDAEDSAQTFRLGFAARAGATVRWTPDFALDARPAALQTALERLPGIGAGQVQVDLGRHDWPDISPLHPYRWIIRWLGTLAEQPPQLLTVEDTIPDPHFFAAADYRLLPTGGIEPVHSPIPLGDPTPAKAGAIGIVTWIHTIGWALTALECRELD